VHTPQRQREVATDLTPDLARHLADSHPQNPCSVYCLTPKRPRCNDRLNSPIPNRVRGPTDQPVALGGDGASGQVRAPHSTAATDTVTNNATKHPLGWGRAIRSRKRLSPLLHVAARCARCDSTERELITWWPSRSTMPRPWTNCQPSSADHDAARPKELWRVEPGRLVPSGRPILSAPGCGRLSALASAGTVWFGRSGISACLDCFVSGREGCEGHLSKGVAERRGRR
jgi:hypothetical protein